MAKENKKIEASSEKETEFHQASLITQATASALAEEFNSKIKELKVRCTLRSRVAAAALEQPQCCCRRPHLWPIWLLLSCSIAAA